MYQYEDASIVNIQNLAIELLFKLITAHAFVDGNKRVATCAFILFLTINNKELRLDKYKLVRLVIALLECKLRKIEFSILISKYIY